MKHRTSRAKRPTLPALLAASIMAAASTAQAAPIPTGVTWLPSDPLNITLDGAHQYDLWLNLAGSANNSRTAPFYFMGNFMGMQPWSVPGNPGYGMFPGNGNWPAPIKAQFNTTTVAGELTKVSNGTGGGPFPSGSTIYYGGASPVPNTDGGTLSAKSQALADVQTVTFQLSLGEAYGYTLFDSGGDGIGADDLPYLTIYDEYGGVMTTLAADYSDIIKKAYNGSLDMPPGSGVDEDVYINTFGLQWDLSAISGTIGSFAVTWTGVQHAQLWSFRLDQSDAAYSDFVFDISSSWLASGGNNLWSNDANWSSGTPQDVGKGIFAEGDSVVIDSNTTIGQVTINSNEDFTIGATNDAVLTVGLNIVTEAGGSGPTHHTIAAKTQFASMVSLDVAADTSLTFTGDINGIGLYKRGQGDLLLSGSNHFSGNLVFAGGTTEIEGRTSTSGGSILDIKNARVILKGDELLDATYGAKLAGTSTHGQRAYLQLGDETTGGITQTLASINAVKPQYVKDLNPNPQSNPPVYIVGGSEEISTLIVKGGIYSGNLGGEGLYENNLSLVVDGVVDLQGTSTYEGDTIVGTGGILRINREAALSANSNLRIEGGLLGLGSFSYLIPDPNVEGGGNGVTVTESLSTFTRELGTGAGQVQFVGSGGFQAVGGDRTVNLGGAGATVTWGEGGFVGDGHRLVLASSNNTTKLTFANGIDLNGANRDIEVQANSLAEISGVIEGDGGFTKRGNGFLLLGSANTYTGPTRIEEGQIQLTSIGNAGGPSVFGNTSNAASNLIIGNGTLNYVGTGHSSTDRNFTISGSSANIANDGTGTVHFTNTAAIEYSYAGNVTLQLRGTNNGANRFDLKITDNGAYTTSLRKGGAGNADSGGYWLIGREDNTYTGQTFVNSGILEVTKLADGGEASSIGSASSASGNLAFFRGGMRYTGDGDETDRLFSVSAYGSTYTANRVDSSGSGALKFTNTGALGITSGASGTTTTGTTGGHLALGGTNQDDNTLAARIYGTAAASRVTKDGTGKWILTNATSSYKGVTEVLGGTLGVTKLAAGSSNSSIGSSTNAAANLILNGGTLQYLGEGDTTDRLFTLGSSGGGLDASGTGAIRFTNAGAISTGASRTLTLSGTNTGNNALVSTIGNSTSVSKSGSGKWALEGSNSYTGKTEVLGGILSVANLKNGGANSNIGASGSGAANLVLDGGTLQYTGAAQTTDRLFTVGLNGGTLDASGSGALTFGNSGALAFQGSGNHTLTLGGSNTGNNTFSLSIGDGGGGITSLIKSGVGTWVLNGSNSFSGSTLISGGTLVLGHNNALGNTSGVTLSGGVLKLNAGITYNGDIHLAGGTVENVVTAGNAYTLGNTGTVVSDSPKSTVAAIAASQQASQNATLEYSFSETLAGGGFAANDQGRLSDVLSLEGTGDDIFVLQLQVAQVHNKAFLGWFDSNTNEWVNAVEGNTGEGLLAQRFEGSWEAFNATYSSYSLQDKLGAWGVDLENGTVWAVINHNSEFAAVPEPGTYLLLLGGGGMAYLMRRRRKAA